MEFPLAAYITAIRYADSEAKISLIGRRLSLRLPYHPDRGGEQRGNRLQLPVIFGNQRAAIQQQRNPICLQSRYPIPSMSNLENTDYEFLPRNPQPLENLLPVSGIQVH